MPIKHNSKKTTTGRPVKKEIQHAEIVKTLGLEQPNISGEYLHVRYIGNNSELLSSCENLPTKQDCHTNIIAHIKLAHGTHMHVHNNALKKPQKYILYVGGTTKPLK